MITFRARRKDVLVAGAAEECPPTFASRWRPSGVALDRIVALRMEAAKFDPVGCAVQGRESVDATFWVRARCSRVPAHPLFIGPKVLPAAAHCRSLEGELSARYAFSAADAKRLSKLGGGPVH